MITNISGEGKMLEGRKLGLKNGRKFTQEKKNKHQMNLTQDGKRKGRMLDFNKQLYIFH